MNNLRLVCILATSFVLVIWAERRAVARLTDANQKLVAVIDARTRTDPVQSITDSRLVIPERSPMAAQASVGPAASGPIIPFDPATEGLWPTNEDYFYLPKSLLRLMEFQKFGPAGDTLALHPNTMTALGIETLAAEKLDTELQKLVLNVKTLEAQRLRPSDIHASTNFPKGAKTSYWIPALDGELASSVSDFFQAAKDLLASTQAEIFEEWARPVVEDRLRGFGPTGRILTLTDERFGRGDRLLTRLEVADEQGKQLHYDEFWTPPYNDIPPGAENLMPKHPFHHIFGENGEIRPKF